MFYLVLLLTVIPSSHLATITTTTHVRQPSHHHDNASHVYISSLLVIQTIYTAYQNSDARRVDVFLTIGIARPSRHSIPLSKPTNNEVTALQLT